MRENKIEIMQNLEEWQQGYKKNEVPEAFTDPKLLKSINTPTELLKVYTIAELKLERHLHIEYIKDLKEIKKQANSETYLIIEKKIEYITEKIAAINKEISNNRGGF